MERDGKPGSIRGTSIACQPLFPGQTPMRAHGSGQDFLSGLGNERWCWHSCEGENDRFAADDLQPFSPDTTTWPVFPHHRSKGEPFSRGGGETVREASSGQNTALTRRGLRLSGLS